MNWYKWPCLLCCVSNNLFLIIKIRISWDHTCFTTSIKVKFWLWVYSQLLSGWSLLQIDLHGLTKSRLSMLDGQKWPRKPNICECLGETYSLVHTQKKTILDLRLVKVSQVWPIFIEKISIFTSPIRFAMKNIFHNQSNYTYMI